MSETRSDVVAQFVEEMEYHGRNERTAAAYRRVLRAFESFLEDRGVAPTEAGRRDCLAYVHRLRREHEPSTVATYASYLNRFYDYLDRIDRYEENPMALVTAEMDESVETNPTRRDVTLPEMRTFVAGVRHPLHRAVVVALLKTGLRAGELCNLDRRDLNLDHPAADWSPRAQLSARPDSLYVSPEHTYGEESGGERRTASNKRKRETVIPVDAELKRTLVRWLAVRPDARSSAEPLLLGTADSWGERLTPDVVHHVVETHAREHGWYETGGGPRENVTPHYFRHFFTTYLRDATGDRGIVKYLRGDVADDVIDTYTHDWGERIREAYLDGIYSVTARSTTDV